MKITSSAFKDGEKMPGKYTCEGENISPQLSWTEIPEGVKSFAVICSDPDAPSGDWVHWVVYNIPPGVSELKEKFPKDKNLPDGTKQGITDFRKTGYDGPCPPSGSHRYYFSLYALDILINKDDLTKSGLLKEMEGHIIANAELTGKYEKIGK
jgi:Raf kinase inhibitor-like YbhB/YbcL family protein